MSYVKGTLSKDEEIKELVKLHWFNYVITFFIGLITFILFLSYIFQDSRKTEGMGFVVFVFVFWFIYDLLQIYTTEYVITNKRVISRKGIIGVSTEELKNTKIESIEIKQSIFGRIFGYATIWFSGTGTSKVKFESVADPWAIKSRVETIVGD